MARKIETYITPKTDREWPANHPIRQKAKVATPEKMALAEFQICRRATDNAPEDAASVPEFKASCCDCGQSIIHRALVNPTVKLICIYCWDEMAKR